MQLAVARAPTIVSCLAGSARHSLLPLCRSYEWDNLLVESQILVSWLALQSLLLSSPLVVL